MAKTKKNKKPRKNTSSTTNTLKNLRAKRGGKKHIVKLLQLGMDQHQSGNFVGAESSYMKILEIQEDHSDALYFLSVIYFDRNEVDKSEFYIRKAIASNSKIADYHMDLGNVLREKNKLEEAISSYKKTVELKPSYAEAYFNLGYVFKELNDNLSAIDNYQQALRHNPEMVEAHVQLGHLFLDMRDAVSAEDHFRKVLVINGTHSDAYNKLGQALAMQNNWESSQQAYTESLKLNPMEPETHYHLSLSYLSAGHYAEGWTEYEWRLKRKEYEDKRTYIKPRWDGSPLNGKTLLITTDGSLQESILFSRFLTQINTLNGQIIFECQKELSTLFVANQFADKVLTKIVEEQPATSFDVYIPLSSVPNCLNITADSINFSNPVFEIPFATRNYWDSQKTPGKLRIGVSKTTQLCDGFFDKLKEFKHENIEFVNLDSEISLLKNDGWLTQIKFPAVETPLVNLSGLIQSLDLIIAEDSLAAYVAGALEKPTWVVLPRHYSWVWIADGVDSSWYPSHQLLKADQQNQWDGVFSKIMEQLVSLAVEE